MTPTPDQKGTGFKDNRAFALAAASLRQALGEMPELTEASKHIMLEDSKEGLDIDIVNQDGRSMFPDGAKQPYERTRQLIQAIAGPLKAVPYRIAITGHTAGEEASPRPKYGPWTFRSTGPMRCARSWRRRVFPRSASPRWRAEPIPIHCSRKTRAWRPIAA